MNVSRQFMAETQLSRRHFLRGQFLRTLQDEQAKTQGLACIRPPWAKAESIFIQDCSRCGDCVKVCETQILKLGVAGFPEVQFQDGECTFCQACVQACSQPIFRDVSEQPWHHKVEITASCLTQQRIECRSCQDSCEMRAIRFQPRLNNVAMPLLDLNICNGCGACLGSCPVSAIQLLFKEMQ